MVHAPAYDSTQDTLEHIQHVRELLNEMINDLERRAEVHDASKLQSPEKEAYDILTPRLSGLTYGSEEYRACLREMKPAITHHYAHNSHHPEHYGYWECNICFTRQPNNEGYCPECRNGQFTFRPDVSGMTLLDVVEMLADWKAASLRHADGDLLKSLEINKERFELSGQLYSILVNTVKVMKWSAAHAH